MVTSALFAGVAAGLLAALMHFAFVQKYILLGEDYESGAAVHFAGVKGAEVQAETGHDHAEHDHGDGAEAGPWQRNGLTTLSYMLLYAGYALVIVAGFALARHFGQPVTPFGGMCWGIAGYVSLFLAPALGLAPDLPGTAAADLTSRQVWFVATAICTATAIAMAAYGRGPIWVLAAAALAALPHLIGAPDLEGFSGLAPPEVAAAFAARTIVVPLAAWSLMGWLAAWLWDRDAVR
jgi:cobalt transporter subunit CbtA